MKTFWIIVALLLCVSAIFIWSPLKVEENSMVIQENQPIAPFTKK